MTWSSCLEALRCSRSGFALANGVPALMLSSSNAPPFGRTPLGISRGMEAEPGDLVFSAVVSCLGGQETISPLTHLGRLARPLL